MAMIPVSTPRRGREDARKRAICEWCGEEIPWPRPNKRFCCRSCKVLASRARKLREVHT